MAARRDKQPKVNARIEIPRLGRKAAGIDPAAAPAESREQERWYLTHPLWSFEWIDLDGPFGWSRCDPGRLSGIRDVLAGYERMTWKEIMFKNEKYNHPVSVAACSKAARDRLTDLGRDDETRLFGLRVGYDERIYGFLMDDGVYKILWWDPRHGQPDSVYPLSQ